MLLAPPEQLAPLAQPGRLDQLVPLEQPVPLERLVPPVPLALSARPAQLVLREQLARQVQLDQLVQPEQPEQPEQPDRLHRRTPSSPMQPRRNPLPLPHRLCSTTTALFREPALRTHRAKPLPN